MTTAPAEKVGAAVAALTPPQTVYRDVRLFGACQGRHQAGPYGVIAGAALVAALP